MKRKIKKKYPIFLERNYHYIYLLNHNEAVAI